jgi:uncharacterized protein
MEEVQSAAPEKPLWRKIVDFPLVAMVIAIVLYACVATLSVLLGKVRPPMPGGLTPVVHVTATVILAFAVYKLAIRHLGGRRHDDLPAQAALKNLGLGLLLGAALFALVALFAGLLGSYRITACCSTGALVSTLFGAGIMAGFMEELLFRGILFRWIEEFAGSWAALAVTSALFGLAHIVNPNATWFSSFAIAVEAGVLLGGAYMLTRTLWMPIGLHVAWNFTQGFIFDVPVSGLDQQGLVEAKLAGPELLSGGQFGLEASVIAVTIATAAGVWLVVLAVRRGELMQPWWMRRRQALRKSAQG